VFEKLVLPYYVYYASIFDAGLNIMRDVNYQNAKKLIKFVVRLYINTVMVLLYCM